MAAQGQAQMVTFDRLVEFAEAILQALGVGPNDAYEAARHLADANACGHDSHGAIRLAEYARDIRLGRISPASKVTVVKKAAAVTVLDGHSGLGLATAAAAVRTAIAAAWANGAAVVVLRHATHVGRLGYYAEAACAAGQALIMTAGAAGPGVGISMIPGTPLRFGGGNPWCFGFPAGPDRPPILVDISSSATAEGKLRLAGAEGRQVAPGLILGPEGRPTTSPGDFYHGGGVVPLGGPALHKGVGLILASAFLGALSMIDDQAPTLAGASWTDPQNGTSGTAEAPAAAVGGVFILAIDPQAFGGALSYADLTATCRDSIIAAALALGGSFTIPGQPEAASRERNRHTGIQLPAAVISELAALSNELGVTPL